MRGGYTIHYLEIWFDYRHCLFSLGQSGIVQCTAGLGLSYLVSAHLEGNQGYCLSFWLLLYNGRLLHVHRYVVLFLNLWGVLQEVAATYLSYTLTLTRAWLCILRGALKIASSIISSFMGFMS